MPAFISNFRFPFCQEGEPLQYSKSFKNRMKTDEKVSGSFKDFSGLF